MKHAGPACLQSLSELLTEIRAWDVLVEKKPGVFYRKGKACLHFHEDPAGTFADVRINEAEFTRYAVNNAEDQRVLLAVLQKALQAPA